MPSNMLNKVWKQEYGVKTMKSGVGNTMNSVRGGQQTMHMVGREMGTGGRWYRPVNVARGMEQRMYSVMYMWE